MDFSQQNQNDNQIDQDQQTKSFLKDLSPNKQQQTQQQKNNRKKIPQKQCNQGRALLQKKQYLLASKSFSKAVMAFQYLLKNQSIGRQQIIPMMKDYIMPSYSNLSLCHLKLGNYESVLVFTNQVLIQDNSNVKALYRRAMAYKCMKQFQQAICDFTSLRKLSPSDQQFSQNMIKQCKLGIQQKRQKQRKMASNFLKNYSHDNQKQTGKKQNKKKENGFLYKITNCLKQSCAKIMFWK